MTNQQPSSIPDLGKTLWTAIAVQNGRDPNPQPPPYVPTSALDAAVHEHYTPTTDTPEENR